MRPMKYVIQQLRRMRVWQFVYAIFVLAALAGAPDSKDSGKALAEPGPDAAADVHYLRAAQ